MLLLRDAYGNVCFGLGGSLEQPTNQTGDVSLHRLWIFLTHNDQILNRRRLHVRILQIQTLQQQRQQRFDLRHQYLRRRVLEDPGQRDQIIRFQRRRGLPEILHDARGADGEDFLPREKTDGGAVFLREDFVGGEEEGEAASGREATGWILEESEEVGEQGGGGGEAEEEGFCDPEEDADCGFGEVFFL